MSFSIIGRNRLFLEACVIVIGIVVGYSLMWISFPSLVNAMIFDESFFGKKIYPDFMKSILVMGGSTGMLVAVFMLAILQLCIQRISDIGIGVRIPIFLLFFCLFAFLFCYISTLFLSSEINMFLILFIPMIIIVALAANAIYILHSFSSFENLRRFSTWPNFFCSIGLFSLVIHAWYAVLAVLYIPI